MSSKYINFNYLILTIKNYRKGRKCHCRVRNFLFKVSFKKKIDCSGTKYFEFELLYCHCHFKFESPIPIFLWSFLLNLSRQFVVHRRSSNSLNSVPESVILFFKSKKIEIFKINFMFFRYPVVQSYPARLNEKEDWALILKIKMPAADINIKLWNYWNPT